jgi:hypothetical protein
MVFTFDCSQSRAAALAPIKALVLENLGLIQNEDDFHLSLTLARHDEHCPHAETDKQQ